MDTTKFEELVEKHNLEAELNLFLHATGDNWNLFDGSDPAESDKE